MHCLIEGEGVEKLSHYIVFFFFFQIDSQNASLQQWLVVDLFVKIYNLYSNLYN